MTIRFILPDETITSPHPGTPDADVSPARLRGRIARRFASRCPADPDAVPPDIRDTIPKSDQAEWWLGWYDERL